MGQLWRRNLCNLLWILLASGAALCHTPRALAGTATAQHDSLLSLLSRPAGGTHQASQPAGAKWHTRGFYNTDEVMGIGMRWVDDLRMYEFTWARILLRRLSLGIWAELDIDNSQLEKMGGVGGGVSALLFPLLPGKRNPFGMFLGGRAGGIQRFDEDWERHGGTLLGYGEAGIFAHLGSSVMLIPRVSMRRTEFRWMRKGEQIGSGYENGISFGLEMKLAKLIPGFLVYSADGRAEYMISLRFGYR